MDAADACADVTTPAEVADPSKAIAGIVFGLSLQTGNYFVFAASAAGSAGVLNVLNGDIFAVTPFAATPAFKAGPNAVNTFRVTWKGTSATAYLNGQQVVTFTTPGFKNTLLGFYDQGAVNGRVAATWAFGNLKVTNVP